MSLLSWFERKPDAAPVLFTLLFLGAAWFLWQALKPEPPLTLEQAKSLNFRASVKGAAFDIPVNYHYTQYSYFKVWPRPTPGEINGTVRREADYIKVAALLPDMAPYTEENAAEYEKPGWGKKVKMMLGHEKNLNLAGYFNKLVKMDTSTLPDMVQYEGWSRNMDEFSSPDLSISIRCDNEPAQSNFYPYCEVLRPYHYKLSIGDPDIPVFHIRYTFSRDYLQQWREIDEKVQALYDRLAENAH
ncbi:MAG: hypothetical protein V1879_04445 [Pseudomonadota bacterium]